MKTRTFLLSFILAPFTSVLLKKPAVQYRVEWRKLHDEPVGTGDMWSSFNPNEPHRQGETDFNLQMQAVHHTMNRLFSIHYSWTERYKVILLETSFIFESKIFQTSSISKLK